MTPRMTRQATGTFTVQIAPVPLADGAADSTLARMTLAKTFEGDLKGTGRGEMLSAGSAATGSAGYVAIERVSGTLHGHRGSFALQHSGTLNRGVPQLSVTVVPESGRDELVGLSGRLQIIIEGGAHRYILDYELPEAPR